LESETNQENFGKTLEISSKNFSKAFERGLNIVIKAKEREERDKNKSALKAYGTTFRGTYPSPTIKEKSTSWREKESKEREAARRKPQTWRGEITP